jgi:predicted transcriptional regulator
MDVLRYIADHHPTTVREVADFLAEAKGHTRTTALNVMERLREKGFLTRDKSENGLYQYAPSVPKAQLLQGLVRDFVDDALGGSLQPFVAYLAQEAEQVSDEDLDDLKRLVQALDQKRKEDAP